MRVQEHLFQGFFGLKKKPDSAAYYKKRLGQLEELNEDLAASVEEFKKVLINHTKKVQAYQEFSEHKDAPSLKKLKEEIKKLEGMFDEDELANDNEKRYVLKIVDIMKDFIDTEDGLDIDAVEREVYSDLMQLKTALERMGPVWEAQLDFIDLDDAIILRTAKPLHDLDASMREESQILHTEKELLGKIGLKTETMKRKTSLKSQNLTRTEQSGLRYREIKYVR